MKAKIVRITVERGSEGLFYAESRDLKGLFVAGHTLDELHREIPIVIRRMYEACDVSVVVSGIEGEDDNSWVAVPLQEENVSLISAH
jgi:predicted RNase H-like HicB family nuclease